MSKQIDLLESIEEVTAEKAAVNVSSIPDRDDVTKCKKCGKAIIFLRSTGPKPVPVNAETVGLHDERYEAKKHVSHFADCPFAKDFRKRGAK